jgi:hypothetical protein
MLAIERDNSLSRLLNNWESKAQVRQNFLLSEAEFDLDKQDFLPEWLPFFGHPIYEKQRHLEQKILSVAWLIYNQVTIDIENDVVIPLCLTWRNDLANKDPLNTLCGPPSLLILLHCLPMVNRILCGIYFVPMNGLISSRVRPYQIKLKL